MKFVFVVWVGALAMSASLDAAPMMPDYVDYIDDDIAAVGIVDIDTPALDEPTPNSQSNDTTKLLKDLIDELRSDVGKEIDEIMHEAQAYFMMLTDRLHNHKQRTTQLINKIQDTMHPNVTYTDCEAAFRAGVITDGVYTVQPSAAHPAFSVYCEFDLEGSWLVIQHRKDGSVPFAAKMWEDYAAGFGDLHGEHWLGNRYLHLLTTSKHYRLFVDLEDWAGVKKHATYSHFLVEDEELQFRLTLGTYSGNAGDAMGLDNGHAFSTIDRDNDGMEHTHRATLSGGGGWWYGPSSYARLNNPYSQRDLVPAWSGITWYQWHGSIHSLKSAKMKLRPEAEDYYDLAVYDEPEYEEDVPDYEMI